LRRIEPRGTDTFLFVVDERRGARWSTAAILPAGTREHALPDGVDAAAVRAVDPARNLSAPTVVSRESRACRAAEVSLRSGSATDPPRLPCDALRPR
jgi:hypothetical protein